MSIVNQLVGSPIATGTVPLDAGSASDVGLAVLQQDVIVNASAAGTANVDAILNLPPNSQIIDIKADVITAWDSITTAAVTVGTAALGAQYFSSASTKAAGRAAFAPTGAQLLAMSNIGQNTALHVTVAQVGATTVGQLILTVLYVQQGS